ncbi:MULTISPECIES: hypothetical protein [Vibrio]|uniref:hypothetical protein n=1 Tax=Vibrio TaxID=662 RepID=UPI0002F60D23|nr:MULTISPECIES: hypothetical protein [Vibrio]MCC4790298.1 hypothetical protein [Vibrio splendidus]OEF71573.1 hypothetical protein A152_14265 [Vibrio tasmaniensis 1F-187]
MKIPKSDLVKLVNALPDDSEVSIKDLSVIYGYYQKGLDDKSCIGFEGHITSKMERNEVLKMAYELAFNESQHSELHD